jgi:hypothetical protein
MSSGKHVCLSDEERHRLLQHASSFGLDVHMGENHVRIVDPSMDLNVELPWDDGWVRLMTEMCSRVAPWLCFRVGVSCRETLFALPDHKIARLAFLFNQHRAKTASA